MSPIIAGDLVIGTCGFVTAQKHFVAVRPTHDGKAEEVWRIEKAVAYMPTPLVKEGKSSPSANWAFSIASRPRRQAHLRTSRRQFSASPACAGNVIYCVNNDGRCFRRGGG